MDPSDAGARIGRPGASSALRSTINVFADTIVWLFHIILTCLKDFVV
jgi:hypothetical protein